VDPLGIGKMIVDFLAKDLSKLRNRIT
jgi:hypothetical protein